MATVQEALIKLEGHEKECAVRYANIEKRLDEGSENLRNSSLCCGGSILSLLASSSWSE